MKPIYKILLVLGLLLSSICANAQFGDKYIIELRGGGNLSEMDIAGANKYKQAKIGFNITSTFALRMTGPLYIQTGLGLTKKGLKQHDKGRYQAENSAVVYKRDVKTTIDANYVQAPLMLGLEFPISRACAINIYGGAYGSYGFKGKINVEGSEIHDPDSSNPIIVNVDEPEVDTFDSGRLKRFDYGAIGSVGLVVDMVSFNLGYEYGLYNVSDNASRELKNRNITVSIGIRF